MITIFVFLKLYTRIWYFWYYLLLRRCVYLKNHNAIRTPLLCESFFPVCIVLYKKTPLLSLNRLGTHINDLKIGKHIGTHIHVRGLNFNALFWKGIWIWVFCFVVGVWKIAQNSLVIIRYHLSLREVWGNNVEMAIAFYVIVIIEISEFLAISDDYDCF